MGPRAHEGHNPRVDPHAVLGVEPGTPAEEVARVYRELAKRHHPDRSGDPERMREINAAYAILRDQVAGYAPPERPATPRPAPTPGAWLDPAVRIALGPELLRALAPGEPVGLLAGAATWDAHDVRLAVTDRRVVWLRDDALTDRVRTISLTDVVAVEVRLGRRGRGGELRIELREGRRVVFGELARDVLIALERLLTQAR